jgi:predicted dehydrogenase
MYQLRLMRTDNFFSGRCDVINGLRKSVRYLGLYGPMRTLYKIAGRARRPIPLVWRARADADIGLIGCGQFGFASIGYVVARQFGGRFRWCLDLDPAAAESFRVACRVANRASDAAEILADPAVKLVYVASNHQSHADYACAALAAGKDVYVEKPVAVTTAQLAQVMAANARFSGRIFAGYNRPFSGAVRFLRDHGGQGFVGGLSLSCFVSGHRIADDHWYRNPDEGTRICGNAGHWIDLFVHVLGWRAVAPDSYRLSLISAQPTEPDDNFVLSIATDQGDVFSLMLTARSEPFEGINETINLQAGEVICKIDDFRRLTLWRGPRLLHRRFWPKDVGHRDAILQPFQPDIFRDWNEVVRSSVLMLAATRMVTSGETEHRLSMATELQALQNMAGSA